MGYHRWQKNQVWEDYANTFEHAGFEVYFSESVCVIDREEEPMYQEKMAFQENVERLTDIFWNVSRIEDTNKKDDATLALLGGLKDLVLRFSSKVN